MPLLPCYSIPSYNASSPFVYNALNRTADIACFSFIKECSRCTISENVSTGLVIGSLVTSLAVIVGAFVLLCAWPSCVASLLCGLCRICCRDPKEYLNRPALSTVRACRRSLVIGGSVLLAVAFYLIASSVVCSQALNSIRETTVELVDDSRIFINDVNRALAPAALANNDNITDLTNILRGTSDALRDVSEFLSYSAITWSFVVLSFVVASILLLLVLIGFLTCRLYTGVARVVAACGCLFLPIVALLTIVFACYALSFAVLANASDSALNAPVPPALYGVGAVLDAAPAQLDKAAADIFAELPFCLGCSELNCQLSQPICNGTQPASLNGSQLATMLSNLTISRPGLPATTLFECAYRLNACNCTADAGCKAVVESSALMTTWPSVRALIQTNLQPSFGPFSSLHVFELAHDVDTFLSREASGLIQVAVGYACAMVFLIVFVLLLVEATKAARPSVYDAELTRGLIVTTVQQSQQTPQETKGYGTVQPAHAATPAYPEARFSADPVYPAPALPGKTLD